MKKIICVALSLVLLSVVAIAKDGEFKKVKKAELPDDLRIVTITIQFEDTGEINRVKVVTNELINGENVGSETGNITDLGFELPDKVAIQILTLRQLAETELKVYKGIN